MSILVESYPESVTIGRRIVKIETNFRTSIQFELLLEDHKNDPKEFVMAGLQLFYGDSWQRFSLEEGQEAIEKMIWFYRCGKEEKKGGSGEASGPSYSFEYDDSYIYAAFMNQYHIDLQTVEYMHWWAFRALFDSLDDRQRISEIIRIRTIKLSDVPKEQQKYYREMKKVYALPKRKKTEKDEALEELLLHGGDPEEIFNQ